MKAFLRKDLVEDGITPSIEYAGFAVDIDWANEEFDSTQPEELDNYFWNMILFDERFEFGMALVNSIDFDFRQE